jgi:hypothetical protein
VAEITPLGNTDICAAGSVVLMANSGSGLIYQWLKNSASIAALLNKHLLQLLLQNIK